MAPIALASGAAEEGAGGRGRGRGRGRGAPVAKAKAGVAKDGDWMKSHT